MQKFQEILFIFWEKLYQSFSKAINQELVASTQSVHRGGLGIALAKTAMGGRLGMEISLEKLRDIKMREDYILYSESQGRLVVTVNPEYASKFEKVMEGSRVVRIGKVRSDNQFIIRNEKGTIIDTNVNEMLKSYKSTFKNY